MSYNQILASLNAGKIAPLYFASGSDQYLYRAFVGALRSSFKKRYGGNANFVQRWGVDLKVAPDVASLLGGGGLFSNASLIMLHEIQDAGTGVKTKLAEQLNDLPPDTVVLVHYPVSDFRKAKWLDDMRNISQLVTLTSPEGSKLPAMIANMAEQHKIKLNEAAIYRLIELSSGELAIIDNELEKLSLYLDEDDHVVSRNLVDRVTGAIENAHVTHFIDAIITRDRALAVQTLVEIDHQGKEGLPYLVAMLYNSLTQLMALRETPEARKSISQGSTSGYFLSKMGAVSKNYDMDELQKATRSLADLDLKFRLGSADTLAVFSEWVSVVV